MTKLSKAQNNAMTILILDEYRAHRRDNDPQARNTRVYGSITQATYKALATKGLLVQRNGAFIMDFTNTGRQMAIDLLHEDAAEEMDDAFHIRDMEAKRVASALKIKQAIMQAHGLRDWEVGVTASHKFMIDGYNYSIHFNQFKGSNSDGSRRRSDYVRISHTRQDGYFIDTTSSSFLVSEAMRMAELMVIAGKVIVSNFLNS